MTAAGYCDLCKLDGVQVITPNYDQAKKQWLCPKHVVWNGDEVVDHHRETPKAAQDGPKMNRADRRREARKKR